MGIPHRANKGGNSLHVTDRRSGKGGGKNYGLGSGSKWVVNDGPGDPDWGWDRTQRSRDRAQLGHRKSTGCSRNPDTVVKAIVGFARSI